MTIIRDDRRLVGGNHVTMSIILSSTDRLFLTQVEVEKMANAIQQELVCRTTTQVNEPVVVADTCLSVAEAWELIDRLNLSRDETVDWLKDGF